MKEYLESCKVDFQNRGTTFMVGVIDDVIATNPKDFDEIIKTLKENRDNQEKFSVEFQYFWSVLTYFEDMKRYYKK